MYIPDINESTAASADTATTLVIRLRKPPACPQCGAPIRSSVLTVRFDVAWCPPCAARHAHEVLRISQLLKHQNFKQYLSTDCGITFFHPPDARLDTIRKIVQHDQYTDLYLCLPMDPWGYKIDHVANAFDPGRIEHPISVVTHHDDGTPLTIAEQKERQRIYLLSAKQQ